MNLNLDIPEALKPNFQRVYRRIPMDLRQNVDFIQDLVLFLKVGGERLARQHLEVAKNDLKLIKTAQRKERRREAMRRTAAAAAENAERDERDALDAENDDDIDADEADEVDDVDEDDTLEDEIQAREDDED
jgi:predicted  nucleic acid-binding Zn-ribbon protein